MLRQQLILHHCAILSGHSEAGPPPALDFRIAIMARNEAIGRDPALDETLARLGLRDIASLLKAFDTEVDDGSATFAALVTALLEAAAHGVPARTAVAVTAVPRTVSIRVPCHDVETGEHAGTLLATSRIVRFSSS